MPGLVSGIGFSSWIIVSSQEIKSYTALSLLCYRLGIRRKQAVDADLDIHGDERWYVRAGYSLLEVFGV